MKKQKIEPFSLTPEEEIRAFNNLTEQFKKWAKGKGLK